MCAFHSRAGRNAASCAVSNGVKNGFKNGTDRHEPAIETDINSTGTANIQDVRLRRLLELIDSDPLGKIHDWAVALNLSQSHLQHLFKQATGLGLGHLLTEKRLQKAADMLATTTLSIKEIACAVGYEHASSFTRAFERRFQRAPREFRMGGDWQASLADRRAS